MLESPQQELVVIVSEEAGFSKTVAVGQFFRTRVVCDVRERNTAPYCKTIAKPRSIQGSRMVRNIPGTTQIGSVLAERCTPSKYTIFFYTSETPEGRRATFRVQG